MPYMMKCSVGSFSIKRDGKCHVFSFFRKNRTENDIMMIGEKKQIEKQTAGERDSLISFVLKK